MTVHFFEPPAFQTIGGFNFGHPSLSLYKDISENSGS